MSPTALSRRSVLAAGGVAGGIVATGATPALARKVLAPVAPSLADDLVDSFGIDIHLNHRTTSYGNYPEVFRWLRLLGVRHVRTRLSPMKPVFDAMEQLSQQGVKIQGTCGALGDPQTMDQIMRAVKNRFARPTDIFSAFEGINEPNNDGVRWSDETRAKTLELFQARAAYGLTAIPIVAPALARVTSGGVEGNTTFEQAASLGDLSSVLDYGNMHVYPRGLPPSSDIAYFRSCSKRVSGDRKIMCTEGGYFTAMGYVGGANPVPEEVAAIYGPQALMEHWLAGTKRFFRYELLDDPSPSPTDREGTLGMIRTGATWVPKPDYYPMRQLLHTMSDPGPRFVAKALDYTLSERPTDLRSAIFAKRNGSYVLALWLDRKVYDPTARKLLVSDTRKSRETVRLTLGTSKSISVQHLSNLDTAPYVTRGTDRLIGITPGVTLVTLS